MPDFDLETIDFLASSSTSSGQPCAGDLVRAGLARVNRIADRDGDVLGLEWTNLAPIPVQIGGEWFAPGETRICE